MSGASSTMRAGEMSHPAARALFQKKKVRGTDRE
jgi:hypothetical protein